MNLCEREKRQNDQLVSVVGNVYTSPCQTEIIDRSKLANNYEEHLRRQTCHPIDRLSRSIGHPSNGIWRFGKSAKGTEHLLGEETHIFCAIFLSVERRNFGNFVRNERTETRSTAFEKMLRRCKCTYMRVSECVLLALGPESPRHDTVGITHWHILIK